MTSLYLFSSVQFSSRWYLCARKSPYALHPVSQKFSQSCLWNSSNVRLTDDGPLSSFQGRSSSASSFHASLLQASSGVMSLALCSQVVSQASQHFRSSEKQAISEGCFARQSICSVVSLYSGMRMTRYLPTSNDASLVFTSTLLISFFLLPISPVKLCRPSPRHPPPPLRPFSPLRL